MVAAAREHAWSTFYTESANVQRFRRKWLLREACKKAQLV